MADAAKFNALLAAQQTADLPEPEVGYIEDVFTAAAGWVVNDGGYYIDGNELVICRLALQRAAATAFAQDGAIHIGNLIADAHPVEFPDDGQIAALSYVGRDGAAKLIGETFFFPSGSVDTYLFGGALASGANTNVVIPQARFLLASQDSTDVA